MNIFNSKTVKIFRVPEESPASGTLTEAHTSEKELRQNNNPALSKNNYENKNTKHLQVELYKK